MRLIYVADDQVVILNGESLRVDVPGGSVRALQWFGDRGEIELVDDDGRPYNVPATAETVKPYVDAWNAAKTQRIQANADEAAARAARPYTERRAEAYALAGATPDKLVVALWESVVEGRPEAVSALQAIRETVKAEIPKT